MYLFGRLKVLPEFPSLVVAASLAIAMLVQAGALMGLMAGFPMLSSLLHGWLKRLGSKRLLISPSQALRIPTFKIPQRPIIP